MTPQFTTDGAIYLLAQMNYCKVRLAKRARRAQHKRMQSAAIIKFARGEPNGSKKPPNGPYSDSYANRSSRSTFTFGITEVDRNTVAGAYLWNVRQELLGRFPNPNVIQRVLIDRAAILSLRLAQIDHKIVSDQNFTVLDSNQTIAWSNALNRVLAALGMVRPSQAWSAGAGPASILKEFGLDKPDAKQPKR